MSDLLQFVRFRDLDNWSVANYLEINQIYSKYDLVKIKDILQQVKNYEVLDDEVNYKLSGIHSYGKGLFHRDIKLGESIKSKNLNRLKTNQFVYSRLGSHTGSFDIVDSKFNGYYVSNEVPTFEFNSTSIEPYFLKLVFLLRKYWDDIEKSLQGTAHKRFKENDFLNLKIPLPPLEIQQKIVKNYQNKLNLAKQQTESAQQKEAEIETYLYQALGIELPEPETQNTDILQFVQFKDLDYWSIEKIHSNISLLSNKYQTFVINDVCSIITDGTHQTPAYIKDGVIFLSAKNVTKEVINWDDIKYVSQKDHDNYCKRIKPSRGDILLAKNGTTGVAAIVDTNKEFSIYVSLAILRTKQDKIDSNYFLTLINSSILRQQFFSKLVGVGVPNLHLREIKEVKIPLPPLTIQNQIANHIQAIKNEIKNLKQQAEQNQADALSEFETEIFTHQVSIKNNNAS